MTVWYFDNYVDLKTGEQELYNYLKEHGTLQDGTVDITEKLKEVNNDNIIYGPTELNVSIYESNETSGYFAVIIEPFMQNQSEYYVIYYGTNGKPINEQNETIKKLISKEYSMINKNGYVRGLQNYS
jgi:dihydroxyacetone kinase-like predicted kinase